MTRNRVWIITVPLIVMLGFASGWLSNSGYGNSWFDGLKKPAFMPPGWVFGVAWTILYILMGVAVAQVIASNAAYRRPAMIMFALQLVLNLSWSPIFFGMHRIAFALVVIVILSALVAVTVRFFWKIRPAAGWMMVPYLAWLAFATLLNSEILVSNG